MVKKSSLQIKKRYWRRKKKGCMDALYLLLRQGGGRASGAEGGTGR